MFDCSYDSWPSGEPYDWGGTNRGTSPSDLIDHHVDLGAGTVKKGRIGIDRFPAPGVNVVADLDRGVKVYSLASAPGEDAVNPYLDGGQLPVIGTGLPFEDSSIRSMISHHALEHIGDGFIGLMDECYRVLKPDAPFRIIVPLFPSTAAVEDPDHVRWFMDGTFDAFCGTPDHMWCESFSVPYTKARFKLVDKDVSPPTPPELRWTAQDRREIRVTLEAVK